MRAMLAGCLMAAFFVFTSNAQDYPCLPVEHAKRALNDMGGLTVFLGETDIVQAYLIALDVDLPDGSDPVAFFLTAISDRVFVTLIEPENCVRWSIVVPANQHVSAWEMAMKGI